MDMNKDIVDLKIRACKTLYKEGFNKKDICTVLSIPEDAWDYIIR